MVMDDERLAAIEYAATEATGGPWAVVKAGPERSIVSKASERYVCHMNSNAPRYWKDVKFIANARTDVPDLIAEIR